MSKRFRLLSLLIPLLVLAFCLHYLVAAFKWRDILPVLAHARLWILLLGGGVATIAYWLVRAARFALLLRNRSIPFRDLYFIGAIGISLSTMTPGQSGEFVKVEMLKRAGHVDRLPGYSVFIAERLIDAVMLLSLGLLAAVWQYREVLHQAEVLLIGVLAVLLGIILVVFLLRKKPGRFGQFVLALHEVFSSWQTVLAACLLTLCSWLLVAAAWWVSLAAIHVILHPVQVVALMAIVTVINLASMVPGGLGVSEASAATVLAHFGIVQQTALAGALMLRAYGLLIVALGLLHWLWWRWRASRQKTEAPGIADTMRNDRPFRV